MINSVAVAPQTVAANNNILFPTDRVRTKSCNSCYGWLSHDIGSGLFTSLHDELGNGNDQYRPHYAA